MFIMAAVFWESKKAIPWIEDDHQKIKFRASYRRTNESVFNLSCIFSHALILSQASYRVNSPNQISSFSLNHMSFRKIHRWIITWTRMYNLWNYLIFRVTNRVSPPWYWNGANLLSLTLTENMADGFVLLEPVFPWCNSINNITV